MTAERAKPGEFGTVQLSDIRQIAALARSIIERPSTPYGDPDGQARIADGMAPLGNLMPVDVLEKLRPATTFRTDFYDPEVLRAIDSGITQVVNCGAGYDDRALRFRSPGVTFFELDLPEVIDDKIGRLAASGIDTAGDVRLGIDFEIDDVAPALESVGHDSTEPTLFLFEHVAAFLSPEGNARLLSGLAHRAVAGSRLALTVEASLDGLDPEAVRETRNLFYGGPELVHTMRSRAAWLTELAATGWRVEEPDRVESIAHTDEILTHRLTAVPEG